MGRPHTYQIQPGWYVAPLSVVELARLRPSSIPPPPNPLGLVYVYVSPEARPTFYAAAHRCSRNVHRLSEGETRRLALSADPGIYDPPDSVATTALNSTFADDRPYLARWLAHHLSGPTSLRAQPTPDRGAATCTSRPGLIYRIAWVTDTTIYPPRTVYLRLHGRDRSDLAARYCSPFRHSDDPELVSFRRAIRIEPSQEDSMDSWHPTSGLNS